MTTLRTLGRANKAVSIRCAANGRYRRLSSLLRANSRLTVETSPTWLSGDRAHALFGRAPVRDHDTPPWTGTVPGAADYLVRQFVMAGY